MPSVVELHTSPELARRWVEYSTLDAEITFYLYQTLKSLMLNLPIRFETLRNTFDLYQRYWLPFGELLTDIERVGIRVNREHLLVG